MIHLKNEKVSFVADEKHGIVTELKFSADSHGMNYLISPETLMRYNYGDEAGNLMGCSLIEFDGQHVETGGREPDEYLKIENGIVFSYKLGGLLLRHKFYLEKDTMKWHIEVRNVSSHTISIEKMLHWMPTGYVMHETIEENIHHSCAMVPSVCGSHPYVICKKRSGSGRNLIVYNNKGEMKSVGSLCRFKNLFFKKSSPSLSGLILYNTVNAYKNAQFQEEKCTDWQYRDMYRTLMLDAGGIFEDEYTFADCDEGEELERVRSLGGATVDFQPVVFCGETVRVRVDYKEDVSSFTVSSANKDGEFVESRGGKSGAGLTVGPFNEPGERKLTVYFADGTFVFVIFAVYRSMREIVEAVCDYIYTDRFIDDPESPHYCAYKSVSPQGESCAKGSLLLFKNMLTKPDINQIRQVERNTVYFLKPNWFDDNFIPLKKYPGGFARMGDLAYLVLQFYLLSKFDDSVLELNSADTYLMWAYKVALYRLEVTPDKRQRELDEMGGPFLAMWSSDDIARDLISRGYGQEGRKLLRLMEENAEKQIRAADGYACIVTEHYFDNAGISVFTEYCLNHGMNKEGLETAKLLLPNVADSTDYRNYAPDRWWEALAPMYHNLWAVYPAKAMLSAYEASMDNRYLFAAYRSMVPMFYNYDWNAVSGLRQLQKGEGVSAYCLTAPNLNLEYASHNRFGQSVFKGEFFDKLNLAGDDWDMGLDMILYLSSFGQKAYVTAVDDAPVAVGGSLTGTLEDMEVSSYAAYPSYYFIEPYGLEIMRGNSSFIINSIRLKNGKCVAVTVSGDGQPEIYAKKGNKIERIFPEITVLEK